MKRKDDSGQAWEDTEVEAAIIRIVAKLSPGFPAKDIRRGTKFGDLGWDQWYRLRVVKPIRNTLHEKLEDNVVLGLDTVGDLIDYVWSRMEDVA